MSGKPMQGVFPILAMPYDDQFRIDEESLRSLVEFNINAGVHGIGIALGSEVFRMSEAERGQVTRTVVDQARGRVPVVINTGAQGTDLAVLYGKTAQGNGADALMVTPPSGVPAAAAETRQYFKAISDAVHIPIFMQDTLATPIRASLARQIAEECEHVRYLKAETPPLALMVAEAVAQAGNLLTVFGGAGGNYFIEEMRRGSKGTMPGSCQPESFVEVWNLVQSGNEQAAREVFYRQILPVNRICDQGWAAFYHVQKEVLRRRGIIRNALVRGPVAPLDETSARELAQIIDDLYGSH